MKLLWQRRAREDYERWRQTDPAVYKIINALIRDIQQRPYQGLGRPKALQLNLKGWWSREITAEHRLVYRVRAKGGKSVLEIAQCRFHYRAAQAGRQLKRQLSCYFAKRQRFNFFPGAVC